ncbi:MAG: hypothetical protein OHK0015_23340 [Chloroflexi bacterium OHK40]
MDQAQYSTLMDGLAVLPDPRKPRGKRFSWPLLLTLLAAGLASGQQTAHAIAHWMTLPAAALRAALPNLTRLPSEATLRRTLRQLDVGLLEAALARLSDPQTIEETARGEVLTPCGTLLQAQTVDGKTLRGATACGAPTHLVSLVQHKSGVTIVQQAVAHKRSELAAVPALLKGRDLTTPSSLWTRS